jgi:hypothetical protein
VLPDYMVHVQLDGRGRLYTVSRRRDAVLVFDSSGTLLTRLGRSGAGPGEYRSIRKVAISNLDSIYVSDWGLGRLTVYSPDLSFVRSQPFPYTSDLVLADGSFVVAQQISTREEIGYPVHLFAPDGIRLRSFGIDVPEHRSDRGLLTTRHVAPARDGSLWLVAPGRYYFEKWNPSSGQLEHSVRVQQDWFAEMGEWPDNERVRPPSIIESFWESERGLLWVVLRVADANWVPPRNANQERILDPDEYDQLFDWLIEVVEPTAGTVVASRRFASVLWTRPPSTVVVTTRVRAGETTSYDVWQPVFFPTGSGR